MQQRRDAPPCLVGRRSHLRGDVGRLGLRHVRHRCLRPGDLWPACHTLAAHRSRARRPPASAVYPACCRRSSWPAGCLDGGPVMILVSDDSKGPGGGRYSPLWEQALSCDQSPRRDIPFVSRAQFDVESLYLFCTWTAAVIARPTPRSTGPSSCGCSATHQPSTTSNDAPLKGGPNGRSSAVLNAFSPARSFSA